MLPFVHLLRFLQENFHSARPAIFLSIVTLAFVVIKTVCVHQNILKYNKAFSLEIYHKSRILCALKADMYQLSLSYTAKTPYCAARLLVENNEEHNE